MNAKNDVTKLACSLQTILCILVCPCVMTGNCEENLYEEEGNSTEMTKINEEE